jgi:hypothetical protein
MPNVGSALTILAFAANGKGRAWRQGNGEPELVSRRADLGASPLLAQSGTSRSCQSMSAFGGKADMG